MLVWKTLRSVASSTLRTGRNSSSRLYRHTSEPKLDSAIVFHNGLLQVAAEKFETLRSNEWRFAPALWPTHEESIYFVVRQDFSATVSPETGEEDMAPNYFKLHEKCDRLAVHKTRTEALYACHLDIFVDVVDAYSEELLIDENFRVVSIASMFAPPQEMEKLNHLASPQTSTLSLTSAHKRPLPILQHLFWGDSTAALLKERYGSEGALHHNVSPVRLNGRRASSTRRRYKSSNSPGHFNPPSDFRYHLDADVTRFVGNLSSTSDTVTFHSLPRYIRHLNRELSPSPRNSASSICGSDSRTLDTEIVNSTRQTTTTMSQTTSFSSADEMSMSLAIEAQESDRSDRLQSSCNGQATTSLDGACNGVTDETTRSTMSALVSTDRPNSLKSHYTIEELRMIDETDTEEMENSATVIGGERVSYAVVTRRHNVENGSKTEKKGGSNGHVQNGNVANSNSDESFNKIEINIETSEFVPVTVPAIELTGSLPPVMNGRSRRSTSVISKHLDHHSTRRFSSFATDSERHRSASPSFEYFQQRSLRGFTFSSNDNRSSRISTTRTLPYTPTRNFLAPRENGQRAMSKPNSVLVYTGGDEQLYDGIRGRLSNLLPPDEITVFNVSIEALQKQPWIELSTVCVILASTKDLDDAAWSKMQSYFNQNGKIIFVCQSKLLASVTGCDSSKEQASIMKFAFGNSNKLEETNKGFAKFLKKTLKTLPKSESINETFRSKDVAANFSVVLKKEPDSPLLLYMHNNGSQHASALFSDATTEQLMAPNSNLLRDSLASVGIKVSDVDMKALTKGVLVSEYDSIVDGISGLRYGEWIGREPKIFLRKTELVQTEGLPIPTGSLLPIEVVQRQKNSSSTSDVNFNFEKYFDQLTTKMGQVIVHVDVATTTMDICSSICDAIPSLSNVVVVANRQTKGKGRGGNEWISPEGVAMFNISFLVPKSSRFSTCLPILQHVFCVAVVDAARHLSGYENFPLRIKWPNDLYYERSHKVGGLLIACNQRDDGYLVSIGAGINVDNEKPTVCLNDMIPRESNTRISREELIAETINRLNYWLTTYENDDGRELRSRYYQYWLHTNEEVLLADYNEKVTIRGLDKYGYLEVRSKPNPDKVFSIGDDGNTFDMMKGLIRHKV